MKKVFVWLLVVSLLAFLAGVAVVLKPFGDADETKISPSAVTLNQTVEPEVKREVILYFGALNAPLLEQEVRNIAECDGEQACIMGLVQALISGPEVKPEAQVPLGPEHVAVLPSEAMLLSVEVIDETARLNFNQALISHHPGGSSSELLTVHAIVNTLAANIPHIRGLELLVNGERINTLRGHVDLSQPVIADFSLVRQRGEVSMVDAVNDNISNNDFDDGQLIDNKLQKNYRGDSIE